MPKLTQEEIKEIAEQLDCGLSLYYNKQTNELLFIPNPDLHPEMEIEDWEEDFDKINKHPDKYIVIDPPKSFYSFDIMFQFTETIADNKLKGVLSQALKRKKPFREFKFAIDNSENFRQKWFDFKNEKLQEWVKNEWESYNDEENILQNE